MTSPCKQLQLFGFRPHNLSYHCASTLHVLARAPEHVSDQLQVIGVSLDWDHVFVALANGQQLVYWCSDNVLRLLNALHQVSSFGNNVTHVISQDRYLTLLLTVSRELICLREVKDDWEVSVITDNVTMVTSCNINDDVKFALVLNNQLAFLTADHVIHSSILPQVTVDDVSCGTNHLLLLDTNGRVYSCGHGNRGQLGHGDVTNRNTPTIIELTVAMTIIRISAGGWHSAMLSGCHDIYTNGWNCDGQLGHNSNVAMVTSPTLVATDDSIEFSLIACGSRHTVAISNTNEVYTWGWNKYEQLERWEPWQQCHIQGIKCSQWNTLYFIT